MNILEQTMTIGSFSGRYSFLSNFYIEPDGTHVEGEFQAAKCRHPSDRDRFKGLAPGQAKRLGRQITLRQDWEYVRISVMLDLLVNKFKDHQQLRELLLNTGTATLIEGNHWHDHFWGVCNGVGQNHLGVLLMSIRDLSRAGLL